MKDFANTYEQKAWQAAVAEYSRMRNWEEKFSFSEKALAYAKARINALETKYPQLKDWWGV